MDMSIPPLKIKILLESNPEIQNLSTEIGRNNRMRHDAVRCNAMWHNVAYILCIIINLIIINSSICVCVYIYIYMYTLIY